jgi:hypothetical protein
VSDTNVYWTPYDAAGNLSLITAPKCGGTAVTLDPYIESTFGPTWVGLAVDSRNVYWVTPFGLVAKAGLAGGTPETLVPGTTAGASGGPAVDDTNVYWIGATDAILDVPINGGAISCSRSRGSGDFWRHRRGNEIAATRGTSTKGV